MAAAAMAAHAHAHAATGPTLVERVERLLLSGGELAIEATGRIGAALESLLVLGHPLGLLVEALRGGEARRRHAVSAAARTHAMTAHALGRRHGGQEGLQSGLLVLTQLKHGAKPLGPALLHALTHLRHLGWIHAHRPMMAALTRRRFGGLGQGRSGDPKGQRGYAGDPGQGVDVFQSFGSICLAPWSFHGAVACFRR
jgi:hypothetical protein